jgi:uncharacterized protein YxeA
MRTSIMEGFGMKKLMILILSVLLMAIMGFSLTTTASITGEIESAEMSDDVNSAP